MTVVEQPQTHVVLPGTNVTFICRGHGRSELLIDNTNAEDAKSYFNSRSITWVYYPSESCDVVSQYAVTVNSSTTNNGTQLYCHFVLTACKATTNTVNLIVVNGKSITNFAD